MTVPIVGVSAARASLREIIAKWTDGVEEARKLPPPKLDEAVDAAVAELTAFTKASMPETSDASERAAIDALDQQALAAIQHFNIIAIGTSVQDIATRSKALKAITAQLDAAAAANVDTAQNLRLTSLSQALDAMAATIASAKALAAKLDTADPDEAAIAAAAGDLVTRFTALKDLVAKGKKKKS